jgi:hypothetical protein
LMVVAGLINQLIWQSVIARLNCGAYGA